MKITRLGPKHADRLIRARHLFDETPSKAAARAYLADDRNVFLLAVEAEAAAGFLRGTILRQVSTTRPQMFLYEIGVDAAYRRRGVGRALIEALLDYCRSRGFEEVFVFTDPGNAPAVALYRSTGARTETPADRMFVYALHPSSKKVGGVAIRGRRGRSRPS